MLSFGRDYTLSAESSRRSETGGATASYREDTLLGWPDYQRGRVAVIFSTLFAAPKRLQSGEWDTQTYADDRQANSIYRAQLEAYERLSGEHPDKFHLIHSLRDLEDTLETWKDSKGNHLENGEKGDGGHPVGLVLLMEGAEGVRDPGELEEWWERGVRLVGPAWSGTRFCGGTGEPGPMTSEGFALLDGMAGLGFGLDLSHMDESAVLGALDVYPGQIVASHSNAQALLKGSDSNRHLSDRAIQGILERDGVIGIVLYNSFLKSGWRKGDPRQAVNLGHIVAQIDYICQMAGDARHVGIGSDFDGGFGLQSAPSGIDTIADLGKLAPLLEERGYQTEDIDAIMGGNWLDRLRRILQPA
jgi:membrane dipeptidase